MSFPTRVRELILSRDGHRCVMCNMRSTQIHHRRPRGMGGTKRQSTSEASNGVVLCGSGTQGCHHTIESNRAEAVANGYLVPQHQEPSTVPILIRGRWVLLDDQGGVHRLP